MKRLRDTLWGYDFFISYHWTSGGSYAVALTAQLRSLGYEVFLDRAEFAMGDEWKQVGELALRNTQRLILVATREAVFESNPVRHEVVIFTERKRQCIPIYFGENFESERSDVLDRLPKDTLHITERRERLEQGPSPEAIELLVASHRIMRRRALRQRLTATAMTLILGFSIFATMSWINAVRAKDQTTKELERREIAEQDRRKEERRHEDTRLIRGAKQALAEFDFTSARALLDTVTDSREDIEWRLVDSAQRLGATATWYGDETFIAAGESEILTLGSDRRLRVRNVAHPSEALVIPWTVEEEQWPYGFESHSWRTHIGRGLVKVGGKSGPEKLWRLDRIEHGPWHADEWLMDSDGKYVVRHSGAGFTLFDVVNLDVAIAAYDPTEVVPWQSFWTPTGFLAGDMNSGEYLWLGYDGRTYRLETSDNERWATEQGWVVELTHDELRIRDASAGFTNVQAFSVDGRPLPLFLRANVKRTSLDGLWLRVQDGSVREYRIDGSEREIFPPIGLASFDREPGDITVFLPNSDRPIIHRTNGGLQVGFEPNREVLEIPEVAIDALGFRHARTHCNEIKSIHRAESDTVLFAAPKTDSCSSEDLELYAWMEKDPSRLAVANEGPFGPGPSDSRLVKIEASFPLAVGEVRSPQSARLSVWKWDEENQRFSPPTTLVSSKVGWARWAIVGGRLVLGDLARQRTEVHTLEKIAGQRGQSGVVTANFLDGERIAMTIHPRGQIIAEARQLSLQGETDGPGSELSIGPVSSSAERFVEVDSKNIFAVDAGGQLTDVYETNHDGSWRHRCRVPRSYDAPSAAFPTWCSPNARLSPRGKWLIVESQDSMEIRATDDLDVGSPLSGAEPQYHFAVDDTHLLRVSRGQGAEELTIQVYKLPIANEGGRSLTIPATLQMRPSKTWIAPGATTLVTALADGSGTVQIDLETGELRPLSKASVGHALDARWSDDGRYFAQLVQAELGLGRVIAIWDMDMPLEPPLVLMLSEGAHDFRMTKESIDILTFDARILHVDFGIDAARSTARGCPTALVREEYLFEPSDLAMERVRRCLARNEALATLEGVRLPWGVAAPNHNDGAR